MLSALGKLAASVGKEFLAEKAVGLLNGKDKNEINDTQNDVSNEVSYDTSDEAPVEISNEAPVEISNEYHSANDDNPAINTAETEGNLETNDTSEDVPEAIPEAIPQEENTAEEVIPEASDTESEFSADNVVIPGEQEATEEIQAVDNNADTTNPTNTLDTTSMQPSSISLSGASSTMPVTSPTPSAPATDIGPTMQSAPSEPSLGATENTEVPNVDQNDTLVEAIENKDPVAVENAIESNPEEAEKVLKDDTALDNEAVQAMDGGNDAEVNNEVVEEALKQDPEEIIDPNFIDAINAEMKSWEEKQYAGKDKKARQEKGQFFTPAELSAKLVNNLEDRDNIRSLGGKPALIDPMSGSGNLLAAAILSKKFKPDEIYANELDPEIYNVLKERLTKLGVPEENITNYDALTDELYDYVKGKSDFIDVIANPDFKLGNKAIDKAREHLGPTGRQASPSKEYMNTYKEMNKLRGKDLKQGLFHSKYDYHAGPYDGFVLDDIKEDFDEETAKEYDRILDEEGEVSAVEYLRQKDPDSPIVKDLIGQIKRPGSAGENLDTPPEWESYDDYSDLENGVNGKYAKYLDEDGNFEGLDYKEISALNHLSKSLHSPTMLERLNRVGDDKIKSLIYKYDDSLKRLKPEVIKEILGPKAYLYDGLSSESNNEKASPSAGILNSASPKGLLGAGLLNLRDNKIPSSSDERPLNGAELEQITEENPELVQEALPNTPIAEEARQITDDSDTRNDEVNNEAVEDTIEIGGDKVRVYKPGEGPYQRVSDESDWINNPDYEPNTDGADAYLHHDEDFLGPDEYIDENGNIQVDPNWKPENADEDFVGPDEVEYNGKIHQIDTSSADELAASSDLTDATLPVEEPKIEDIPDEAFTDMEELGVENLDKVEEAPVKTKEQAKAKQRLMHWLKSKHLDQSSKSAPVESSASDNHNERLSMAGRRAGALSMPASGSGSVSSTSMGNSAERQPEPHTSNSIASKAPLPVALEDNQGREVSVNGKATTMPVSGKNGSMRSGSFGLMSKPSKNTKVGKPVGATSSGAYHTQSNGSMNSKQTSGIGQAVTNGKEAIIERIKTLLKELPEEEVSKLGFSPVRNTYKGKSLEQYDGYTLQNISKQLEELIGE